MWNPGLTYFDILSPSSWTCHWQRHPLVPRSGHCSLGICRRSGRCSEPPLGSEHLHSLRVEMLIALLFLKYCNVYHNISFKVSWSLINITVTTNINIGHQNEQFWTTQKSNLCTCSHIINVYSYNPHHNRYCFHRWCLMSDLQRHYLQNRRGRCWWCCLETREWHEEA